MKKITEKEITKLYKEGVRDFSKIKAPLCDFSGVNLSGASFRNADLKYSSFFKANLANADFSEADLKWSDFSFANTKETKFTRANLSWSTLNNIHVENTDFSFAQVQWCTIFNTDLSKCKIEKTNFSCTAFAQTEVTKEGIKIVIETAEGLPIPAEVITSIKEGAIKNVGLSTEVADKSFELVSQLSEYRTIGRNSLRGYAGRATIDVYSSGIGSISLYITGVSIDEYVDRTNSGSIDAYISRSNQSSYRARRGYTL